jgi:hypothetical protein
MQATERVWCGTPAPFCNCRARGCCTLLLAPVPEQTRSRKEQTGFAVIWPANQQGLPAALRRYAGTTATDARLRWELPTARSVGELLPLLDGFGRDVRSRDPAGRCGRSTC